MTSAIWTPISTRWYKNILCGYSWSMSVMKDFVFSSISIIFIKLFALLDRLYDHALFIIYICFINILGHFIQLSAWTSVHFIHLLRKSLLNVAIEEWYWIPTCPVREVSLSAFWMRNYSVWTQDLLEANQTRHITWYTTGI